MNGTTAWTLIEDTDGLYWIISAATQAFGNMNLCVKSPTASGNEIIPVPFSSDPTCKW